MDTLLEESKEELINICRRLNIPHSGKNKKLLASDIIKKKEQNTNELKNRTINYNNSILNDEPKKELINICKDLGLKYSNKTKENLISIILEKKENFIKEIKLEEKNNEIDDKYNKKDLEKKNMAKLKSICKEMKISGFSKLKKEDLIEQILINQNEDINLFSQKNLEKNNVKELKDMCRQLDINGFSKMIKEELIEKIIEFKK